MVAASALAAGAFAVVELVSDGDETTTPTTAATTTTTEPIGVPGSRPVTSTAPGADAEPEAGIPDVALAVTRVGDFTMPVMARPRPGDDALYVIEQRGAVKRMPPGGRAVTVLDLGDEVSTGNEQGLLGLAFSPDGERMYLDFTDRAGDTHVVEYEMDDDGPDPDSRRELLTVAQPFSNHNAGHLAFGPDGHLYVSLGDGGSGGDPEGNGQDPGTLLGSILRLDPSPSGDEPYGIPPDNPFVGDPERRDEIWAYGLRNPWRFSFDRETGDLWIGDVGQNEIEEVDFEPAGSGGGRNYGWNLMEGTRQFAGEPPPGHVPPVHEYPLTGGNCAVTGGYVYRGQAIPELAGVYVFADFCRGDLKGLRRTGEASAEVGDLGLHVDQISSVAEDASGELYVLSLSDGLFRLEPG